MTGGSSLPIGPRRDAVERVERDIEVVRETLNLGLDLNYSDTGFWREGMTHLRRLQAEHARLLTCHIHEITGAAEWYREQDRVRRVALEKGTTDG